jgi:hypothetical protein
VGIFRSPQCVVCGRPVKGLEDARQEGKLWFCSPSHHLDYRGPSETKKRRGPLRRVLRWTLIVFGVLVVLVVIGAFVGTGTKSKAAKEGHKTVASGPGSRAHPVPLGHSAAVGGGWWLRIKSVNWNAAAAIAAVPGQYTGKKPPPEAQEVMPSAVVSFRGGGSADVRLDFADRVFVIGSHRAPYHWDYGTNACGPDEAKLPPPDLQPKVGSGGNSVFSGTTLSGHICFEVAKNDVSSLMLYVERPLPATATLGQQRTRVWFALR